MAVLDDLLGRGGESSAGAIGGNIVGTIEIVVVVVIAIAIIVGILIFSKKIRRKSNIKVEFRLPRNVVTYEDGSISGSINKEWGKGFYDSAHGVVYLKRKGRKEVAMKPFDVKKYLSNDNILTVIQVGVEDYRPVLDNSYIELEDDEPMRDKEGKIILDNHGRALHERSALINARIDTSESKSWKTQWERENKNAYSLKSWLQEHGTFLAVGIILLMNFVGFAILYSVIKRG